ncbi:MAG TPA: hypothetical protein VNV43_15480 [Candidatus Acidoferrales bacterium]|jgi:hypothetical protein|nr:hypothetical protein [Candidatus Acidoferrales bacterium]
MNEKSRNWKFFRAGGFDQVKLESAADLANLDQLDQKLWVALACPTHGLELDSQTLGWIDSDKDGRIRPPEVIAAAKWATNLLKNPEILLARTSALPLDAINDSTKTGRDILATAKQILADIGKKDAAEITVEDIADMEKAFAATKFNGDGIVPADVADDDATKAAIADIIACMGGEPDTSGKPGVNQEKLEAFFHEAEAYSNWWKQAEADKTIMPLGAATGAASVAVNAVAAKVNDFFARCRLAAFDARALPALNRQTWEYMPLLEKDLSANATEFSGFPLAHVAPGKALPLARDVNPAWAAALADLQSCAVKPLLGDKDSLTEAEWNSIQAKLTPFQKQSSGGVGASVEKLGLARVREILGGKFKEGITALIVQDAAMAGQANTIRLVRYNRDLYTLCVNFVSFKDFYSRKQPATFQAGRLYLDQRSCDLCLTVEDPAKHATLAGLAGAYLAYLDCTRKSTGEKRNVVAVFSQGDDGNLMVGRNGVFYNRKGDDFDATITQIISNPISIRQAFWAPYKKLVRYIQEQVAKRAAAAETAASAKLQASATTAAAPPTKIDTGTLAAIGLVLTTLLSALTLLFHAVFGMQPVWLIPLAILAVFLAISAPSVIMAWLKLRQRNLGPILDANGWAVNSRAKLSVPFGASLTQTATLPPGSQRDLRDPYAERSRVVETIIIIVLIIIIGLGIAWYLGKLDRVLPPKAKSVTVLGTNAPAYTPPPAPATGTNAPAGR